MDFILSIGYAIRSTYKTIKNSSKEDINIIIWYLKRECNYISNKYWILNCASKSFEHGFTLKDHKLSAFLFYAYSTNKSNPKKKINKTSERMKKKMKKKESEDENKI